MQARITSAFGNIPPIETWLPKIGRPVTPRVINMEDGRAALAMRLTGIPFESASDELLDNQFENLSGIFAGLGRDHGSNLSIWTTFRRRKVEFGQEYAFSSSFLQQFSNKYLSRFRDGEYYENSFFITLVFKYSDFDDGIKTIEQLGDEAFKSLRDYDPEYLEVYERNGIQFSNSYRFMGELINGVETPVPVTAAPGYEAIPDSWLHFGYDLLVIRTEMKEKFAACFDLKDFPDAGWGQLSPLLTLNAEFTITQSFGCMTAYDADKALGSQINKLESAGDRAKHQVVEMSEARGYVSSGELAFGDYHGALVVYGDTAKQAKENGELVKVRSKGECGVGWVKATLSAPFTYFSQIPGAKTKPRPMPKTSRNLAATFSLHDYSAGKSRGNAIGDGSAVIPLQTASKKLYCFNYHATRDDETNIGEKVAGHTLMLGSTGVGKTTIQLAILSFFMRFDPMLFGLDFGRGMEIFFRAIGGTYIPLQRGVPTGAAPLADLPDTPTNRQFLYELVNTCSRDQDGKLSAEDKKTIKTAVDTVVELEDPRLRTFSRLLESIHEEGGDSLYLRLGRWCRAADGPLAWVFDNPAGSMIDVTQQRHVCFDVTAFLVEGYEPSEPLFAYLFHLKSLMQRGGGLMATIIEEFWAALKFRMTWEMMEKSLSSGRKEGEFVVLVSQQPEQAMKSNIFPQIRSLTATKIFLPDPEGKLDVYREVNMTEKEFREFAKLSKSSRTFLVKQSNQSAFAKMDLYGFDDEIVVLSGNPENVALMEKIIGETSEDPDIWLPILQERVFEANVRKKLILEHGNDPAVYMPALEKAMQERRARRDAVTRPSRPKAA
ncbi:VirB4 family type IV secretion/conjugal transfer ATPase [Paraburkholderia susongensis]|uniref:Type IV secretion system protein VirB4 n=1 Tax=Paraburkholderia susongensis TaxID=1515439 RepID=A0A1X7M787_9BURK|nr:transporter [Paraburkholderia susongensis]SMG61567.1 type IV secretion system protein VirB4 [Paraburkholderia susongensis]